MVMLTPEMIAEKEKEKNYPKYTFSNRRIAGSYCAACPCTISLSKPLHVGTAIDKYLTPKYDFIAPARMSLNNKFLIPEQKIKFGDDLLFGKFRNFPQKNDKNVDFSVGNTEDELKEHMRELHYEVSKEDYDGKSKSLMESFFEMKGKPEIWEDERWNNALKFNQNIKSFMEAALSPPGGKQRGGGQLGIHQRLIAAGMDISAITRADDLGAPATNLGKPTAGAWNRFDFANGMAFMANGIQYVYIYATNYCYSQINKLYDVTLEYHFYDVFGLDDDDLLEYGQDKTPIKTLFGYEVPNIQLDYSEGISAWWQLQFNHGYAPLVTRGVVSLDFTVYL